MKSLPVDVPVDFFESVFQPQAVDAAKGTLAFQGRRVLVPVLLVLDQFRVEEALTVLRQLRILVAACHGPLDETLCLLHARVNARNTLLSTLLQTVGIQV